MKKILILEVVILAVVVIGALILCLNPAQETFAPGSTDVSTEQTTLPTETTEPAPTWLAFPENRELTAKEYFVFDCEQDRIVSSSHGETQRIYPASITKLFTAYVALEHLSPTDNIAAGTELDLVVWGSSVAGIQLGDVLTVEQLIEAMLLPSGNDAAYVLATAAGREILSEPEADSRYAVEVFMEKMNGRAKELGMTGSHFVNPDGIHEDSHYMTFPDLAILGKLSIDNPTILKYANLPVGNNPRFVEGAEGEDAPKQWKNTNELIHPDSRYYCPYAVGLKTGQTPMAGSCLLSAFHYEGSRYIIGVFGCPEKDDRFPDTLQLFNETIQK